MTISIYPVILSGGSGTRLWPLSRDLSPKQFLPLVDDKSLLAGTAKRVSGGRFGLPIVVCNKDHRMLVAEQLEDIGIKPEAIILEPIARNTAPAIAAAAALIHARDPNGLLLVLPSDHLVLNIDALGHAIAAAAQAAGAGNLVTFGIKPTTPETGYGYIQNGAPLNDMPGVYRVGRFVEKPDLKTAEAYLAGGDWSWNSGMFVFPAKLLLDELARFEPEMAAASVAAFEHATTEGPFVSLDKSCFAKAASKSIDYALMERTHHAAVVPADLGWSDIGSWSALWDIGTKDASGNVVIGDVLVEDVKTSYLRSHGPLIAMLGIDNAIVVATADVVMIAAKDRAQDVKVLANRLRAAGRPEATAHRLVQEVWGAYRTLDVGDGFEVRRLSVKPGGKISALGQPEQGRQWTVVDGKARVIRNTEVFDLTEGKSIEIPVGMPHALENLGGDILELIEVRFGVAATR